jgi:exonuclease SbcC
LLVLGQVNALTQQIQRESAEVQTLSQEEQSLTNEWQEVQLAEYSSEYSG